MLILYVLRIRSIAWIEDARAMRPALLINPAYELVKTQLVYASIFAFYPVVYKYTFSDEVTIRVLESAFVEAKAEAPHPVVSLPVSVRVDTWALLQAFFVHS